MAEKEISNIIKLQIEAGKASPAPPVGPALGSSGVNIMQFVKEFNDRTFDFVIKTPPAAFLVKKYAKIDKGSSKGANNVVATLTKDQLKEIAEIKLPDLNAYDVEAAMNIVEGTARNMGVAIKGLNDKELAEQGKEALEAEKEQKAREALLEEMEKELEEAKENNNTEVETVEETTTTEE